MKPLSMPWMALVLHLALASSPLLAQHPPAGEWGREPASEPTRSQPTATDIDEALHCFRALSVRKQEKALVAVRAASF